jgi:hypothetical protein
MILVILTGKTWEKSRICDSGGKFLDPLSSEASRRSTSPLSTGRLTNEKIICPLFTKEGVGEVCPLI